MQETLTPTGFHQTRHGEPESGGIPKVKKFKLNHDGTARLGPSELRENPGWRWVLHFARGSLLDLTPPN
jgi:hypothetical protein